MALAKLSGVPESGNVEEDEGGAGVGGEVVAQGGLGELTIGEVEKEEGGGLESLPTSNIVEGESVDVGSPVAEKTQSEPASNDLMPWMKVGVVEY